MANIGPLEIIIVLVIVLLLFGAKRLPELGSSTGRAIRGFAMGLKGEEEEPKELKPGAPAKVPAESHEERTPKT